MGKITKRAAAVVAAGATKGKATRGRRPMVRASWVPHTFSLLYLVHGVTIDDVAQATNGAVSPHTIKRWQAPGSPSKPTPEQRLAVAKALTDITGERVAGTDLGREIVGVTFRYAGKGAGGAV